MIHSKIILSLFTLLGLGLFAVGCSSNHQNLQTYNNKLMTLMNNNSKDMQAMNAAMTSGDYKKAEEVRKTWASHLKDALEQANEIGGYQGDETLQSAIVNGLSTYKKIVTDDYKQLIAIRSKGDSSQQEKENKLLKNINQAFTKAANSINQAASAFISKHRTANAES